MAWNSSARLLTNVFCMWPSLQHWLRHYVQENTTLFGKTHEQMADRLIAQHYFHGVLVHRVVKLSFSNKCFSDRWLPYIYPRTADAKRKHFHVAWLPSYVVLLRFIFVQIPSFSFQLWALLMKTTVVNHGESGNRFKRRFWKLFWELINLLMSLQIRPAFFTSDFSKIIPESWGCSLYTSAAYTRVFTVF